MTTRYDTLIPATETSTSARSISVSLNAAATRASASPMTSSPRKIGSMRQSDGQTPRSRIVEIGSRVVMVFPKSRIRRYGNSGVKLTISFTARRNCEFHGDS